MKVYLALANGGGGYVFKENENMNVYLSGVASRPYVMDNQEMNIYLAGGGGEKKRIYENMNIYLAGVDSGNINYSHRSNDAIKLFYNEKIYILESFYYISDWMLPYIREHWNFMLDSGAFTFLENAKKGKEINWNDYIIKYSNFINELNIKDFIELDIDNVVGLKEVERLRDILEQKTNKKCIPVWHKKRGLEYYKKMCKEYPYIAIGGIVSGEIKSKDYKVFTNLLNIAKEYGTKVHGLGFTNSEGMKKYPFYSVDSTAWVYGNRAGFLWKFNGETLDKNYLPKGKRLKSREAAIHNFTEWIKFQKYAEANL